MNDRGMAQFSAGTVDLYALQSGQTGCVAHPVSYLMSAEDSFSGGEAAGA